MKILVFPDLHQAPNLLLVEDVIAREKPDRSIFLGDYFDQLHDTVADAEAAAEWLRYSLRYADRVHLMGNHDLHYWKPDNPHVRASAFTYEKARAIQRILGEDGFAQLRFCHWESGWLFTHAGLTAGYTHATSPAELQQELDAALDSVRAWLVAPHGPVPPLLESGGQDGHGGILSCEFEAFQPIPSINQIFGHSSFRCVRSKCTEGSQNWCLDTSLRGVGWQHYGLLQDGALGIFRATGEAEIQVAGYRGQVEEEYPEVDCP